MFDWSTTEIVFVVAPACPACGAGKPIIVRSQANGDGSVTRKAICKRCSARFKIVVENSASVLPDFGNADF